MSEVLIPKRIFKQTSKGTSHEGTCDELSQGKGMISAKEVRLKELAFGGRQKGHCGWSNNRVVDETMGHSEMGNRWGL